MRKTVSLLLAAGCLLAGPAAQAQEKVPLVFNQDSAWALDYGDDYCRLARTFTNGQEQLAVSLERIQPGDAMRLVLVGDGLKLYRSAEQIGYRFLPSGKSRKTAFWRSKTADGKDYLNLGSAVMLADFTPPPPPAAGTPPAPPPPYSRDGEQATAKGVTGILLDTGLTDPVQIETGSLNAPVKALQACADDLLKSWGLDAEKHKTLSRPVMPAGPTSGWLGSGTIPFGEMGKLAGGANPVRLMIDATGKPTACHIHWPSLEKAMNDRICGTLMEKGKFTPAMDKDGQPMASYWTADLFWLMPGPGGRPGA